MRINKFLSFCGVSSRRKADILIEEKRVMIDGRVARKGDVVTDGSCVTVDGQKVEPKRKLYYLFYKPRGYITTLFDPHKRPSIKEFVEKIGFRVFPVGRLDKDAEGLLLLTNDGDLANKILHPRYNVPKTYIVFLDGDLGWDEMEKIKTGVKLSDGFTKPARIERIKKKIYKITIFEGRKREIKRIFKRFGKKVLRLKRISIANLRLDGLLPGEYRELREDEIFELKKYIGGCNGEK